MKRIITGVLALLIITLTATGQEVKEYYTVYLVRHAEKATGSDPSLTDCGKERAAHLAEFISQKEISRIFSTGYKRTIETALPSSELLGIEIENYDPRDLEAFALKLRSIAGNILVVGHSNTTPELASILVDDEVPPIDDDEYGLIYKVTLFERKEGFGLECTSFVTIITSDFVCSREQGGN